jgi:hypothetical protein
MAQKLPIVPIVTAAKRGGRWEVQIENVHQMDGVSGYFLYDPADPPYEVESHGRGGELQLTEPQARDLHRQLDKLIRERDGHGSGD